MDIAVIGCGTGGPAAALFFARNGHRVEIFERVADPRPVGAGIVLQPTGMAALAELGLLAPILAHGARIDRLTGITTRGRPILDLAYADLAPGLFGLGLHRGVLFATLLDAVRAAGIPLHTGVEIAALNERTDCVELAGRRFDRVVVADGARSHLRPPWARVRPYPWGALWFNAPAGVHTNVLAQTYRDTRQMLGFLPIGRGPEGNTPLVSVFWSLRADAVEAWRARGIDAWKADVLALAPDAPVGAVTSPDDVLFAPYFDVTMPRWHTDRIVWIGDAGHAMSPQLGQGANLALLDAWVLAQCDTLAEYSERRRAHLRFYGFASRWLTPFFQSSYPVLAPLRDAFAMPLHRWDWYRKQMLLSLAGTKTGLTSTLLDVPLSRPQIAGI